MRAHGGRAGPAREAEKVLDRQLQGKIRRRPGVAAVQRHEQIDLGRPGSDAVNGLEALQHGSVVKQPKVLDVERACNDGLRDGPEAARLGA